MKLSVIIPVYDEPLEVITRAVNSIKNQFGYKPEEVEIIVSADLPARKLVIPDVRFIASDKNRGPGIARQRGLDICRGKYVTFLDADDIWYNALAYTLFLKDIYEHNDIDIVKFPILEQDAQRGFRQLSIDSTWCFSKLYRKAFLDEYSIRFRDDLRVHEDSWFIRLAELHNPRILCHGDMIYLWAYNPRSTVRRDGGSYWQESFDSYLAVIYDLQAEKAKLGFDVYNDALFNFAYAYANISRMDEPYATTCIRVLRSRLTNVELHVLLRDSALADNVRAAESQPNMPSILPHMTMAQFINTLEGYHENSV